MKYILITLLLASSASFAQERRPSYQGYGVPQPDVSAEVEVTQDTELESDTADSVPTPAAQNGPMSTELPPIAETLPLPPEPRVLIAPAAKLQMGNGSTLESAVINTIGPKLLSIPSNNIESTTTFEVKPLEVRPVDVQPVEMTPARWQLDLIVFRTGGQQALRAERWPPNPGRPAIEQFDISAESAINSLQEVSNRLEESPSHEPLLRRSLQFDQLPAFLRSRGSAFESTQSIVDADVVSGHSIMPTPASRYRWPEVLGTVSLKQAEKLSVTVDFLFSYTTALRFRGSSSADPLLSGGFEAAPDEKLYQLGHIRLQQSAVANVDKLIYFDNPAIGAIIKLSEIPPQPLFPQQLAVEPDSPSALESDLKPSAEIAAEDASTTEPQTELMLESTMTPDPAPVEGPVENISPALPPAPESTPTSAPE